MRLDQPRAQPEICATFIELHHRKILGDPLVLSKAYSVSSRVHQALGAHGWKAFVPLCIRSLRGRWDALFGAESKTSDDIDGGLGIHTCGITSLQSLQIESSNKAEGTRYEPTDPDAFQQIIRHIPVEHVEQSVFIDVGCGRGRVLFLAEQSGFKHVIGIDFASDLCEVARENISAYLSRKQSEATFNVEHADACTYSFPPFPLIIFLYNPFNQSVMETFVRSLEQSLIVTPRSVHVLYSMPFWQGPWKRSTLFRRERSSSILNRHWYAVYRNTI